MRYILIILVFLSVGAKAQMVIKAHPNYRPLSKPFVLNTDTNAIVAYSLRKLRSEYTGSAIRVRRDSTGQTESDIGFTANGDLDTAALKNFIRNNNGFVTTFYDQSTFGRNLTQTTQASQPRIISLGVIDRENGLPTLVFDGINDRLRRAVSDSLFRNKGEGSIYFVGKFNTIPTSTFRNLVFVAVNSSNFGRASLSNGGTGSLNKYHLSSRRLDLEITRSVTGTLTMDTTKINLINNLYDWANNDAFLYVNNSLDNSNLNLWTTPAQNTSNTNSAGISIGDNLNNDAPANCRISEVILFNTVGNRSVISQNINDYWLIY